MINAIMSWIPGWWYIGLIIAPLVFGVLMANETKDNDIVFQFILGIAIGLVVWVMGSIALTACYYIFLGLWYITLGMFFPSIWDVPFTVWAFIAVVALIAGAATPAYEYIVVIFRIPK